MIRGSLSTASSFRRRTCSHRNGRCGDRLRGHNGDQVAHELHLVSISHLHCAVTMAESFDTTLRYFNGAFDDELAGFYQSASLLLAQQSPCNFWGVIELLKGN